MINQQPSSSRSVCKVNTQDPENFDEELKSLVTAWLTFPSLARQVLLQDRIPLVVQLDRESIVERHYFLSLVFS